MEQDAQFARVIIAPHGGFAARHLPARRNIVPAVRTVINGVKKETFVTGIDGEIGLLEKRLRDGQPSLVIADAVFGLAIALEIAAEAKPPLAVRSNVG